MEKIKSRESKLFNLEGLKRFIRYFMVGGIASVVDFIVSNMLYFVLKNSSKVISELFNQLASSLGGIAVGLVINYFLGLKFVFKQKASLKDFIKICEISFVGIVMTIILTKFNVSVLHIPFYFFKIVCMGIVFIWNYFARTCLVYK